jgi:DNA adenine methylase
LNVSKSSKLATPLKTHGGKHYLASKIVPLMPAHKHYCEPFAGGLSVLLAKDHAGISECVNDISGPLTAFWQTLMNPELFADFLRKVQGMPVSEELFQNADDCLYAWPENKVDTVTLAVAFFVVARQSLAGRGKDFAPLSKTRTRRGMNEQASAWLTAIEGLPAVHQRMQRVVVLNRCALEVIKTQDSYGTLFYLDPPYLPSTRSARKVYQYEMSEGDHLTLLNVLTTIKGRFLLSGYRSDLYDDHTAAHGWNWVDFKVPNNSAGGKKKRRMVERVWMNFVPQEQDGA